MSEMKKATISVNAEQYELFKKITKENDSDVSKTIRKFISKYIKKHQKKQEVKDEITIQSF